MTYVITQGCIDVRDRACVDECPVDCIYEGARMLYIHPDECVDCGACEPVCPAEAIFYEDDLTSDRSEYLTVGAEVFASLGTPGGASSMTRPITDHPVVAAALPGVPSQER
ncbi:ferredoxin [Streptomyces flaveolus]|uniref:ferredoxin n=1 Tax=Streptomyces flaveolus TaxID=67297 RepID=UPI003813B870